MRRRVASSRDTLQAHNLPPTEYMELNYRPMLLPHEATAIGWLLLATCMVFALAALLWLVGWFGAGLSLAINFAGGAIIALIAFRKLPRKSSQPFRPLLVAGWVMAALLVLSVLALATNDPRPTAFVIALGPPLVAAVVFAYWAARQYAFWTTANPQVEWHAARHWRGLWLKILSGRIPPECPEILTCRLAFVALLFQFWIGYEVAAHSGSSPADPERQAATGFMALLITLGPLPCYWIVWNLIGFVPRLPIGLTLKVTLRALQIYFGYLSKDQGAPGIFRFPDRWLRAASDRFAFALLVIAMLMLCPLLMAGPGGVTSPYALIHGVAAALPDFGFPDSFLRTIVAGAIAILWPALALYCITWFSLGSVLTRYWLALEAPDAYVQSRTKSAWAISVDRILNSRDSLEREHILLGRSLFGDYPVLLHRELLHQHAHLVGDSGSRKTSLGIAPLIAQLIAGQQCSVVVLDLKGDRALFETARLEAAHSRAEFRWFTSELGLSSHVFNPLDQDHFRRMTPNQQTQLVLEGLSLDYGDAYGRGFFSAMSETVLLNLLRRFDIRSFKQLHTFLLDKHANELAGNKEDIKDARHLVALTARLASISPFNVIKSDLDSRPAARDACIEMSEILSRSQVVYFNLRSPAEPIGSPAIAKMAMYSLFAAAATRLPEQQHHVYIIIDEFQQIVSENVRLVLEQARSSKLSFIIAHQALGQLDRKGIDIRDTVSACTAFKQIFRASDPDTIKHLEAMSGEAAYETLSWQQEIDLTTDVNGDDTFTPSQAAASVVMVQETTGTRLERNTIIDISATANTSLISVTEGSGYTQFSGYVTPIISDYHISMKEYKERNAAPWPEPTTETVIVERPPSYLSDKMRPPDSSDPNSPSP